MVKVLRPQMSGISVVISEVLCLLAYTDTLFASMHACKRFGIFSACVAESLDVLACII